MLTEISPDPDPVSRRHDAAIPVAWRAAWHKPGTEFGAALAFREADGAAAGLRRGESLAEAGLASAVRGAALDQFCHGTIVAGPG